MTRLPAHRVQLLRPLGQPLCRWRSLQRPTMYISFSLAVAFAVGPQLPQAIAQTTALPPLEPLTQHTSPNNATVLHVDPAIGQDSPHRGSAAAPFKTLTYAIDLARPNTTIQLAPGLYSEATGEVFPIALKPYVTISGDPRTQGQHILIRGGGEFASPTLPKHNVTILGGANQATLQGVTILNPNPEGYAVQIEASSPTIRENTFTGNTQGAIVVTGNSQSLIQNNLVINNHQQGIAIYGTAHPVIENNVFEQTGIAVLVDNTAAPVIHRNQITKNTSGIIIQGASQPQIRNNTIQGNTEYGVFATAQTRPELDMTTGKNSIRNNGKADVSAPVTSLQLPGVQAATQSESAAKATEAETAASTQSGSSTGKAPDAIAPDAIAPDRPKHTDIPDTTSTKPSTGDTQTSAAVSPPETVAPPVTPQATPPAMPESGSGVNPPERAHAQASDQSTQPETPPSQARSPLPAPTAPKKSDELPSQATVPNPRPSTAPAVQPGEAKAPATPESEKPVVPPTVPLKPLLPNPTDRPMATPEAIAPPRSSNAVPSPIETRAPITFGQELPDSSVPATSHSTKPNPPTSVPNSVPTSVPNSVVVPIVPLNKSAPRLETPRSQPDTPAPAPPSTAVSPSHTVVLEDFPIPSDLQPKAVSRPPSSQPEESRPMQVVPLKQSATPTRLTAPPPTPAVTATSPNQRAASPTGITADSFPAPNPTIAAKAVPIIKSAAPVDAGTPRPPLPVVTALPKPLPAPAPSQVTQRETTSIPIPVPPPEQGDRPILPVAPQPLSTTPLSTTPLSTAPLSTAPLYRVPPVSNSVQSPDPLMRIQMANLLPVPPDNIPVGNIGDMPKVYTTGNGRSVSPDQEVIPGLSSGATSGATAVNYRVVVQIRDESHQEQLKQVFPDAFPSTFQGQQVMQVGAFGDRTKADQLAKIINSQGFPAIVDPLR